MSTASKREYAIDYVGRGRPNETSGGGNVLLTTSEHALDGPEHSGDLPADRVSVEDVAGHFTGTDAEAVLAELAAELEAIGPAAGGAFTVEVQTLQSRRYLMEDGSFRDPFTTGDGVLSVGSISTITDDAKYNAWPSIARMHSGELLLLYTKADSHHSDETGKLVGRIGTEGIAGAVTWGAEFTIYDHPSVWASGQDLSVISTGRVFASGFYGAFATNPLDGAFVVYSDDDGRTWSSLIVVNSTLTSYSYGSGGVLELPNGDLLQCVEGKNSGDTFSRVVVLRSSDGGDTWGSQVTIATGTRNYYEAQLGLLDDDSILVLLRTSDAAGDIYQSRSTDGGATWSTPVLAFAGHGQPNWIQSSTGTLVAITRENLGTGTGGVWAYTSVDRATTWSAKTDVDLTPYEMEYGCPIELLDGRILVVYGYQPASAITNADIKQVYLSEGLAGILDDVDAAIAAAQAAAEATAAAALAAHIASGGSGGGDHVHVVDEQFSGNASTTVFPLANSAVPDSVMAYVSGTRTPVTLGGTFLDQITFGSAPASGTSNISVDYAAALT